MRCLLFGRLQVLPLPYLKLVGENCDEALRGKVENGLYVMESN
jgi:hypothetical protein